MVTVPSLFAFVLFTPLAEVLDHAASTRPRPRPHRPGPAHPSHRPWPGSARKPARSHDPGSGSGMHHVRHPAPGSCRASRQHRHRQRGSAAPGPQPPGPPARRWPDNPGAKGRDPAHLPGRPRMARAAERPQPRQADRAVGTRHRRSRPLLPPGRRGGRLPGRHRLRHPRHHPDHRRAGRQRAHRGIRCRVRR